MGTAATLRKPITTLCGTDIVAISTHVRDFLHGVPVRIERAAAVARPGGIGYRLRNASRPSGVSPCDRCKMNELPVEAEHVTELSIAEPRRALRDRIEHRLDIGRRAADDVEHLARRGLVFERFLQLALARLLGLEQPRVLDGDDGLVGEGFEQFDLAVSVKGRTSLRRTTMVPIASPCQQQRHREDRAMSQLERVRLTLRELGSGGRKVMNMNCRPVQD